MRLIAAVRPQGVSGRLEQARPAGGRTHRAVCPDGSFSCCGRDGEAPRAPARQVGRSKALRVAEQTAVYGGGDEPLEERFEPTAVATRVAGARRAGDASPKDGTARSPISGADFTRREFASCGRWSAAWRAAPRGTMRPAGALVLAGSLLRRGRTRDAQAVIEDGHDYAVRAGQEATLVDFAILSGEAWIDAGRLDEADSVLGAALSAARALADPERVAAAALTRSRAARTGAASTPSAEAVLASAPDVATTRVRRRLLASRLAVGLGDLNRAMSLVTQVSADTAAGDAGTRAAVASVTAFVHLAVGDLNAAERDLAEAIALARSRPRSAARHACAPAERRSGAGARTAGDRAGPLAAPRAPGEDRAADRARAVGSREGLVGARPRRARRRREACARHRPRRARPLRRPSVGRDGAQAVALRYGRSVRRRARRDSARLPDRGRRDRAAQGRLRAGTPASARRRGRLRGGAGRAARTSSPATACGSRPPSPSGRSTAGITIAPHRLDDRIEAAAPIEYGGERIGALCARWTIGSTYDTSRARRRC